MELMISKKLCKGCGICVEECPKDVIKLVDGKSVIDDFSKCIKCSACILICPDHAIFTDEEKFKQNS